MQLVVPNQQGGVYDFAERLAERSGAEAAVVPLTQGAALTWKIGAGDSIFLQMSAYGFEKRGVPFWLLREMKRRRGEIGKLGVFFHELYAFSSPLHSAFWLSPAQRWIACQMANLSDFWVTNRQASADWLRARTAPKPSSVLPVFSNVGERLVSCEERLARLVIFGSSGLRRATYLAAGLRLFVWARLHGIEIHDVGADLEDMRLSKLLQVERVVQHGRLVSNEVHDLLCSARFGLLSYPVDYVAKSGVFAAFCAHGLCPILLNRRYPPVDGLRPGVHYASDFPDCVNEEQVARISNAASNWYQTHNVDAHVANLLSCLRT